MGNVLDEVKDTITTNINERLGSPLLGSFALFWLAFNWRGGFFLLHPNEKLDSIAKLEHYNEHYTDMWFLFGWPVICAVLFVWLYPFLAHYAFTHWKKKEHEKSDAAIVIRKQHYKSGEEYAELERKYYLAKAEIRALNKKYEDEVVGVQEKYDKEMMNSSERIVNLEKYVAELEGKAKEKDELLSSKVEMTEQLREENDKQEHEIVSKQRMLEEFAKNLEASNAAVARLVSEGSNLVNYFKSKAAVPYQSDNKVKEFSKIIEEYKIIETIENFANKKELKGNILLDPGVIKDI